MRGLRRVGTAVCLIVLAGIVSACVVETGPGPYHRGNWCYWHPEACR
jgi:hypothetical protein